MKSEFRITLSENRQSVQIVTEEKETGRVASGTLTSAELLNLIRTLMQARSGMADQITSGFPAPSDAIPLFDPYWSVSPNDVTMQGGLQQDVFVPGLGWLAFVIPETEARKLVGFMEEKLAPVSTIKPN